MRRVIAGINMTLDGFCDHTSVTPDEHIHYHYSNLLSNSDAILFGRITYQLMEFWKPLANRPSGNSSMDDFASKIDRIQKYVFSRTLKSLDWESAKLSGQDVSDTVLELKQQPGKDVLIGSRSLIIQCLNHNLIDEFQLCIHPVVVGKGLPLLENLNSDVYFKLSKTKVFESGAIILYYVPLRK